MNKTLFQSPIYEYIAAGKMNMKMTYYLVKSENMSIMAEKKIIIENIFIIVNCQQHS